jgi:hypothetical protein
VISNNINVDKIYQISDADYHKTELGGKLVAALCRVKGKIVEVYVNYVSNKEIINSAKTQITQK